MSDREDEIGAEVDVEEIVDNTRKTKQFSDDIKKDWPRSTSKTKPAFDLFPPPEAMFALAQLATDGVKKHGFRNWEEGKPYSSPWAAAQRHAWKFWGGEDYDPENGSHHLIAAAWRLIQLYTYVVREIGEDDRPEGAVVGEDL
jgi:hypothetical protein